MEQRLCMSYVATGSTAEQIQEKHRVEENERVGSDL
jgi:hypothetical protein